MSEKIKELRPGESAVITGYEGKDPVYKNKLLSMGLTRGIVIKVLRIAPLGDPVEIEVRGFNLSLRRAEADMLQVRRVNNE